MPDINTFAYERIVDFLDAMHQEIKRILIAEFDQSWLESGVSKHFHPDYFSRVQEMLESPMRVVDMGKTEEDLYGIEHLWQIINGNWRIFGNLFGTRSQDKLRVDAALGEISEVRHNVAHRRGKHLMRRVDLIRFLDNCGRLLSALDSTESRKFVEWSEVIGNGGMPWGESLMGWLPPSNEIYEEFIGRSDELAGLTEWLASDNLEVSIHGYGGAGKSALAHRFAREVKQSSDDRFIAVCWVSAKDREFVGGTAQQKTADFADLDGLLQAIWIALYGIDNARDGLTSNELISELSEMPILLVVDDFNTILGDQNIYEFLRFQLRGTGTRIIYTSRDFIQGMRNLDVPPFSDIELAEFVFQKCREYNIRGGHEKECLDRIAAIKSVTDGYPLFVNDLIRYAVTVGIKDAIETWQSRRGDAAREYALRSQVINESWLELLFALAEARIALVTDDLSWVSGLSKEDTIAGLESLQMRNLVNLVWNDESGTTAFRMNANTSRLVRQTFERDNRLKWESISARYKTLTGQRQSQLGKRAIGDLIAQATKPKISPEDAIYVLRSGMTGELSTAADLHSMLGWLYTKSSSSHTLEAREAFNNAHQFGSQKMDTYWHWASLEQRDAASMELPSRENALQWKECGRVCQLGIERCGASRPLCDKAGFAAIQEANAWYLVNQFTDCETAFEHAAMWYRRALDAPQHERFPVSDGAIYRGLIAALEGASKFEQLIDAFNDWSISRSDPDALRREFQRVRLQNLEFRSIQSRRMQALAQALNPA